MRLTRRQALIGAGSAWLALQTGRAPARPRPSAPIALQRGIDLTPRGLLRPGTPQDYRVLRAQPWAAPLIARTSHLRVWADWPTLQPTPLGLEDPANPGLPSLLALDGQIDAAVADGVAVIVMPYRYPRWANGASSPRDDKAPEYRLPDAGFGPGTPWAAFVDALWARYAGRMTCFEVVNEPNLQVWPQGGVAERVASMMLTVDAAAARHDLAATCLAPSHSDADSERPEVITEQAPFTEALLAALDRRGFEGGCHWVWSFHNYNDIERGGQRASALRNRLAGRWRGLLASDGGPLLYATEGGCRLSAVRRRYGHGLSAAEQRNAQADLLRDALARYAVTDGVGLFTQYTVHADPRYDCGLREPDGAARPAYAAWVT